MTLGGLAHATTPAAARRGRTWVTSCSLVVNLERKEEKLGPSYHSVAAPSG